MLIIGKPFLVLGSLAGVSAVAVGSYFGVSALDSHFSKQINSPKEELTEVDPNLQKDNPANTEQTTGTLSGAKVGPGVVASESDSSQQSPQPNPSPVQTPAVTGESHNQPSGSDNAGAVGETS